MKRKTYPKYKPSGVEWLGDVPEHWEVKRLKYSASINDEVLPETTSPDAEFDYVDIGGVSAADGITQTAQVVFETAPSRARRRVRHGDTIVSTVRTYLRAIAPIKNQPENLIVSTGFAVLRPRKIEPDFLAYALRESAFVESVVARSVGVSYPACNASEVGGIAIPLPDPAEQRSIAAFLDRETGRIDSLIAKKRELVERLKEKRTALISHTVTHGLPPDAAAKAGLPVNPQLKPSGVEWLGNIPEHWEVTRLKWFFKHVYRYPTYYDIQYVDDGVPEIRGEALVDGEIVELDGQRFISQETNARFPQTILDIGDIVMSVRGTMGKIGVVRSNFKGANITANLLRLSPDGQQATPSFLSWLFRSGFFAQALDRVCPQTTIQTVTMPQLSAIALPCPPLPEQAAIAAYLHEETAKLDALVAKIEEAVERLQEYRAALITAAVTGKIDVRECYQYGNSSC